MLGYIEDFLGVLIIIINNNLKGQKIYKLLNMLFGLIKYVDLKLYVYKHVNK